MIEPSFFNPTLTVYERRIIDQWPSPPLISNHIRTLGEEIEAAKSIAKDENSGSENQWTIPGPIRTPQQPLAMPLPSRSWIDESPGNNLHL